jgi:hypothetical protein
MAVIRSPRVKKMYVVFQWLVKIHPAHVSFSILQKKEDWLTAAPKFPCSETPELKHLWLPVDEWLS